MFFKFRLLSVNCSSLRLLHSAWCLPRSATAAARDKSSIVTSRHFAGGHLQSAFTLAVSLPTLTSFLDTHVATSTRCRPRQTRITSASRPISCPTPIGSCCNSLAPARSLESRLLDLISLVYTSQLSGRHRTCAQRHNSVHCSTHYSVL